LKARNILISYLGTNEYHSVSHCKTAKAMWDTLEILHEGTDDVKQSKINTLVQQYELFRMEDGESISSIQMRFNHIINVTPTTDENRGVVAGAQGTTMSGSQQFIVELNHTGMRGILRSCRYGTTWLKDGL